MEVMMMMVLQYGDVLLTPSVMERIVYDDFTDIRKGLWRSED